MVLATPFRLKGDVIAALKSACEKGLILWCTKTPYGDVWQVEFPDGAISPLYKHFEDALNLLINYYNREYGGKEAEEK